MKIGVVGSGMVGGSAAFAAVMTGAASEIVLVDVNEKLAQAQTEDILHAVPYAHPARVSAGHYEQLKGRAGIDTETLADFELAAMLANDNDLIRSPPIPA